MNMILNDMNTYLMDHLMFTSIASVQNGKPFENGHPQRDTKACHLLCVSVASMSIYSSCVIFALPAPVESLRAKIRLYNSSVTFTCT